MDKGTQEADSQQRAQTGQQQVPSVLSTLLTSLHTVNSKSASVCAVYCLLFTHFTMSHSPGGFVSCVCCTMSTNKGESVTGGGQLPIAEVVRALVIHVPPPHPLHFPPYLTTHPPHHPSLCDHIILSITAWTDLHFTDHRQQHHKLRNH